MSRIFAGPARPRLATLPETDATVKNVNSLIQRVAGTSLGEIENLISELESLRDLLHAEGQRVQREIAGYAHLSHAAMKSTRIIAENLSQWKTRRRESPAELTIAATALAAIAAPAGRGDFVLAVRTRTGSTNPSPCEPYLLTLRRTAS